jgi:hypothetical protein
MEIKVTTKFKEFLAQQDKRVDFATSDLFKKVMSGNVTAKPFSIKGDCRPNSSSSSPERSQPLDQAELDGLVSLLCRKSRQS